MKVGDLVIGVTHDLTGMRYPMLVVDIIDKKCWRTTELGKKVDWTKIDPEPHAIVIIRGNTQTIPLTDLEVISEGR